MAGGVKGAAAAGEGGGYDNRKQSFYVGEQMLEEVRAEAKRQDRSMSWLIQQAWRIAKADIKRFPSITDALCARE